MDQLPKVKMATSYWFGLSGKVPFVYPGSNPSSGLGAAVTVGLDNVFAATPALPKRFGVFTVQKSATGMPFQIVAAGGAGTGVWDFSAARTVRSDFDALMLGLEALQLLPGRLALIRGWLAQALPLTFAESLYLRHGYDPANRSVDLNPGTRLRIDFQAHQAVDPGQSALNGFVGAGTSYAEVVQLPSDQYGVVTAFDPFVAGLQGVAVPVPAGGAGGVVDLRSLPALPYWRLLYPPALATADGTGSAAPAQNPVVIGAATWQDLTTAAATYLATGTVPPAAMVFRGRTVVVPEIPVYLQGERRFVTLGTTVRHLLSAFGPVPWLSNGSVQFAVISGAQGYGRSYTQLTGGSTPSWTVGGYSVVQFTGATGTYGAYGTTFDSFDLPVLGGDIFAVQVSG